MYQTSSGQETELAGKIRKCLASPCWSRDADTDQSSRETFNKPAHAPSAPPQ